MAAGGGGSSGAGKETAGATTRSDLNNFQFPEGKRELEKYRRCALAEAAREEAPKGSRVRGGASLGAGKEAGEREPGSWGGAAGVSGAPPKGGFGGERWTRGPGGWRAEVQKARDPRAPLPSPADLRGQGGAHPAVRG